MSRGNGFKRPEWVRPPPSKPSPVTRGVRMMITREMVSVSHPKENVLRSTRYEAQVRKLTCRRCGIAGFSQFCHTDEGKGQGIKTDVRRGWAGCGPHPEGNTTVPGCHWYVGTSGNMTREERRAFEEWAAFSTRAEILTLGQWPPRLPLWIEKEGQSLIGCAGPAIYSIAPDQSKGGHRV